MMVERRWRGETAGGSVAHFAAVHVAGASAVDVWCGALALVLVCCVCVTVVE